MAIQLSTAVRNARLDAIESAIGTAAVLKIRTGAAPADVATADSGTVLATLTLPSDWLAAASRAARRSQARGPIPARMQRERQRISAFMHRMGPRSTCRAL